MLVFVKDRQSRPQRPSLTGLKTAFENAKDGILESVLNENLSEFA